MNPDDVLTEWERLAQEATEGPWDVEEDDAAQELSVRAGTARTTWETTANGVRIGTPAWSYKATDVIHEVDFDTDGADEDDPDLRQIAADAEFIAAARTGWPAATAALRAVLDLHRPTNDDGAVYCGWSTERGIWNGCGQAWPCTTVRRITEALGRQG